MDVAGGNFSENHSADVKTRSCSLAIFTFVNSWKSFFWPLIVTSSDKYKTLPIGLYAFSGQYGTDWSALMAATAISIIPGVIFYIFFQKSLVEGISLTGMGGR